MDGLQCETEYEFRVKAVSADGQGVRAVNSRNANSDYTPVFTCTTGIWPPSNEGSKTTTTMGEALVEFMDKSNNEDHFVLEYGETSGGPYPVQVMLPSASGTSAAVETTLADIACDTSYYGQLVPVDAAGGRSTPPPEFEIRTLPCGIPTVNTYGLIFMALLISLSSLGAANVKRGR